MRTFISIVIFLSLVGCSRQNRGDVFVVPVEYDSISIDIDSIHLSSKFSNEFLHFLVWKFPNASATIFYTANDFQESVTLTDTSYMFGVVSNNNRLAIINSLPKNLSKEESNSYFSKTGFFTYIDSADKVKQDSIFDERIKWVKASTEIEKEYLRFYSLIRNFEQDYLIIVSKKSFKNSPW